MTVRLLQFEFFAEAANFGPLARLQTPAGDEQNWPDRASNDEKDGREHHVGSIRVHCRVLYELTDLSGAGVDRARRVGTN